MTDYARSLKTGSVWTRDETLLDILRSWADEHGRTPRRKDFGEDDDLPHPEAWIRRWGTWSEACRAADLEAPGDPCPLCDLNAQDLAHHLRHRCEGADDV
jgi:hypothetical protein